MLSPILNLYRMIAILLFETFLNRTWLLKNYKRINKLNPFNFHLNCLILILQFIRLKIKTRFAIINAVCQI